MTIKREIQDYYGQPAWLDEQGSWYSADGRRLLRAGGGGSTSLVLQEGSRGRGVGEPFAPLRERWRVPVMSDKSVKALLQEDVKEEIVEFEKYKRMNH